MASKKKSAVVEPTHHEMKEFGNASFRARDDEQRSRLSRALDQHFEEWPAGSLNLPPLLEQRRLEYRIATGFFKYQTTFNNVVISQITYDSDVDQLMAAHGLEKPAYRTDQEKRSSYLGVLVSAGLDATDLLFRAGIAPGHIVRFLKFVPWTVKVDTLPVPELGGYEEVYAVDLSATDIRGSLDLGAALRSGACRMQRTEDGEHIYVDKNGAPWDPETPVEMEGW